MSTSVALAAYWVLGVNKALGEPLERLRIPLPMAVGAVLAILDCLLHGLRVLHAAIVDDEGAAPAQARANPDKDADAAMLAAVERSLARPSPPSTPPTLLPRFRLPGMAFVPDHIGPPPEEIARARKMIRTAVLRGAAEIANAIRPGPQADAAPAQPLSAQLALLTRQMRDSMVVMSAELRADPQRQELLALSLVTLSVSLALRLPPL